ncbi:MAG: 30S ribosomal protein S27e [Candidatus Micrarchaeota archaeon]
MSRFLKVVCECGENAIIFGDSKAAVSCKKCGKVLASPRGGRAHVSCRIIEVLS